MVASGSPCCSRLALLLSALCLASATPLNAPLPGGDSARVGGVLTRRATPAAAAAKQPAPAPAPAKKRTCAEIRKGMKMGDKGYCSVDCTCLHGQGDCDLLAGGATQCSKGLTCVQNIGAAFSLAATVDVCYDLSKAYSGGCFAMRKELGVANGASDGYCNAVCKCGHGEGDCDSHAGGTGVEDCQKGLKCTKDLGANFGLKASAGRGIPDVCVDPRKTVPVLKRAPAPPAKAPAPAPAPAQLKTAAECAALRKGVANGDPSKYCSAECPCGHGQGDCDSHKGGIAGLKDCQPGLTCMKDMGDRFGLHKTKGHGMPDVCIDPNAKLPAKPDCAALRKGKKNGAADGWCSDYCPCSEGEGDCDSHDGGTSVDDCKSGLVCTQDGGAKRGMKAEKGHGIPDTCEDPKKAAGAKPPKAPAPAPAKATAAASCAALRKGKKNGDRGYCSESCTCLHGQGDCDLIAGKSECAKGLTCVQNIGAKFRLKSDVDVCYDLVKYKLSAAECTAFRKVTLGVGNGASSSFCSAVCPCNHGEGDCDSHSGGTNVKDCQPGLKCMKDMGDRFGMHKTKGHGMPDVCIDKDKNLPPKPDCKALHAKSQNGAPDGWCSDYCPCKHGEGDCDSHDGGTAVDDCMPGLVCTKNLGRTAWTKFGIKPAKGQDHIDICIDPKATSAKQAPAPKGGKAPAPSPVVKVKTDAECAVIRKKFKNGSPSGHCSAACPCGHGQGDCDSHKGGIAGLKDCKPGLVCTKDAGANFGLHSTTGHGMPDVCVDPKTMAPPPPDCAKLRAGKKNSDVDGWCTDFCPCGHGEGDCDSHKGGTTDSDCKNGLTCMKDMGDRFGMHKTKGHGMPDVCIDPTAELPAKPDCVKLRAGKKNGAPNGWCSDYCPCSEGEGDCDSHDGGTSVDDCKPGLVCTKGGGAKRGMKAEKGHGIPDTCEKAGGAKPSPSNGPSPPAANKKVDCAKFRKSMTLGSKMFCSESCPCGHGEGDCDLLGVQTMSRQCAKGLTCVQNVGALFGFGKSVDVCYDLKRPYPGGCAAMRSKLGVANGAPDGYCNAVCKCGHGEGDCDSHAGGTGVDDCEAGLVCTKDSAAKFGIKQVVPGNVADMCVDPKLGVPDGKGGSIGTNPDGSMKNSDLYGGGTALPKLDEMSGGQLGIVAGAMLGLLLVCKYTCCSSSAASGNPYGDTARRPPGIPGAGSSSGRGSKSAYSPVSGRGEEIELSNRGDLGGGGLGGDEDYFDDSDEESIDKWEDFQANKKSSSGRTKKPLRKANAKGERKARSSSRGI